MDAEEADEQEGGETVISTWRKGCTCWIITYVMGHGAQLTKHFTSVKQKQRTAITPQLHWPRIEMRSATGSLGEKREW